MRTLRVRFIATFEATIAVSNNATPKEILDEVANIDIPENEDCHYVEDSFEPLVDDNGNLKIFKGKNQTVMLAKC